MTPKLCATCGKDRTAKGKPLTKRFCSPECFNRQRYDSHGEFKDGRGLAYREDEERGELRDSAKAFNPFEGLFDND